jgi:ABC-2 type transport system permease protein
VTGLGAIYLQQFRTTLASQLQYRAMLFIWLIGQVLEPLIYLVVWSAVSRSTGGNVGGYTTGEFGAYFILLMLINHSTFTWIMWEQEYRIRQGTFSFALLKPVHPIHSDIADNLSYKLITAPVMLMVALALSLAFHPEFHFSPWLLAAFFPALALAFLMRFLMEWTLAMVAFWTTRVSAINQMYYVLLLFFSGQIAPLSLLPGPIRAIASILPFRWMISFPIELLLGRLTPSQVLAGFAAQVAWLAVCLILMKVVWRAGVRVYSAVGA